MAVASVQPRVERVPVADLTPHPRNVREGDVGAISVSLQEFGQYRPIVVQRSTPEGEPRNVVIAGTHTWKAAAALGWPEIEAVVLDVSDDLALRIMLADNRTHDLGRDRQDDLATLLVELGNEKMFGTGYDAETLDQILLDLGKYDPGASILAEFEGIGQGLSERAEMMKGRDAAGNEYVALHISLTLVQRDAVMRAFAKAKQQGYATQPEALEAMARKFMEGE